MEGIIAILFGSHLILVGVIALLIKDAIWQANRYQRERIDHAHTRAELHILSQSLGPVP